MRHGIAASIYNNPGMDRQNRGKEAGTAHYQRKKSDSGPEKRGILYGRGRVSARSRGKADSGGVWEGSAAGAGCDRQDVYLPEDERSGRGEGIGASYGISGGEADGGHVGQRVLCDVFSGGGRGRALDGGRGDHL